jgi:protein-S-isoprenylcysteine O-methyltransferase Ste14
MTSRLKKPTPTYKHLLRLALLLGAFTLGLLAAWLQPGAVLALLIVSGLVVLALVGQGCYLWQVERMREFNRRNRVKRPAQRKEEVMQ